MDAEENLFDIDHPERVAAKLREIRTANGQFFPRSLEEKQVVTWLTQQEDRMRREKPPFTDPLKINGLADMTHDIEKKRDWQFLDDYLQAVGERNTNAAAAAAHAGAKDFLAPAFLTLADQWELKRTLLGIEAARRNIMDFVAVLGDTVPPTSDWAIQNLERLIEFAANQNQPMLWQIVKIYQSGGRFPGMNMVAARIYKMNRDTVLMLTRPLKKPPPQLPAGEEQKMLTKS